MTKEEVLALKNEKPSIYVQILQKRHTETWDEIISFNKEHGFDSVSTPQMIYNWAYGITEVPKCEVCGSPCAFSSMGKFGYANTCSRLCARKAKSTKQKRIDTNIKRYGCEYGVQSEDVKAKIRESNKKKYGVECVLGSESIKQKIKETNQKKYGVDYPMMSSEIKAKREETYIKKYGVSSPLQSPLIQEKMRCTCNEKFGLNAAANSIDALFRCNEIRHLDAYDKIKAANPKYELLTPIEEFEYVRGNLKWKCNLCGTEFKTNGYTNLKPRCKCQYKNTKEVGLYDFIKSLSPDAILNDRTSIGNGMELDVYVPSKKIGFELDGLYWHREGAVPNNYHYEKTKAANEKGIRVIHIFEDEWDQKKRIVQEKIRYLLGKKSKSIMARKCIVQEIDGKTAHRFLDKYHIQGTDNALYYVGLYYGKYLVGVSSYQPIKKGGNEYSLSRYATIFSRTIVGGMGKTLKHFIKTHHPTMIRTYADLRISEGNLYDILGFKKIATIKPKYWYTKTFKERIHRFNLRKSSFNKNGMMYDSSSSEKKLAEENGFVRIYDCGYIKYEMYI